ncbi:MAG TPA: zf-HC2 domain-containing protein [Terriglobales bacterium]|nr:zf-HC2 domain-containing protein [Terriglobales bacterium]
MSCAAWLAQHDRLADGELPPAEAAALAAHLRGCGECTAEVVARLEMKRAVRAAGRAYAPSAEFRERVRRSIAVPPRRSRFRGWVPALATAAAFLVVVVVGSAWWAQQQRQRQALAEIVDLHVSNLAGSSPVDVVSSDRHTVKPWFAGRLPFTFDLPELAGSPFTLIGGRVAYFHETAGALLLFQVRQHRISVFIFPERAHVAAVPASATEMNFHVTSWDQGGLHYLAITDASPGDLAALQALLLRAH